MKYTHLPEEAHAHKGRGPLARRNLTHVEVHPPEGGSTRTT